MELLKEQFNRLKKELHGKVEAHERTNQNNEQWKVTSINLRECVACLILLCQNVNCVVLKERGQKEAILT